MTKSISKTRESEVRYQAEKRKAETLAEDLKQERDTRRRMEKNLHEHVCCAHGHDCSGKKRCSSNERDFCDENGMVGATQE